MPAHYTEIVHDALHRLAQPPKSNAFQLYPSQPAILPPSVVTRTVLISFKDNSTIEPM